MALSCISTRFNDIWEFLLHLNEKMNFKLTHDIVQSFNVYINLLMVYESSIVKMTQCIVEVLQC